MRGFNQNTKAVYPSPIELPVGLVNRLRVFDIDGSADYEPHNGLRQAADLITG
jgi:hypothetical protein